MSGAVTMLRPSTLWTWALPWAIGSVRGWALFGALVLLSVPVAAGDELGGEGVRWSPVPGWVEPADVVSLLDHPEGKDADATVDYLLVDRQVRLAASGPETVYYHYAYRIKARPALEDWSSLEVEFEPSFQEVDLHRVEVYRDGAWRDRSRRSLVSRQLLEADVQRHMFDRRVSLQVVLEDVRVGDVVQYAYSIHGANPVFSDRASGSFSLGWSLPVARQRLRFLAHEGRNLSFRAYGTDLAPRTRRVGEYVETVWEEFGTGTYPVEESVPADWLPFPMVQYSEYASWAEVVSWGEPLYFPRGRPPAELVEVARHLTSKAGSTADLAVLARDWVQNEIRYFAVVLGEHSHAPYSPEQVLKRRYGDCKDKSVLLIALLQVMGLEAWPAMVNGEWEGGIADWLPSPYAFDHVIVVADWGEGPVWMDPTMNHQGGRGTDLYIPAYGKALEIRAGVDALSDVPVSQSRPGLTRVAYRYRLADSSGPARVEIESRFHRWRAEDMRGTVADTTPAAILEDYLDYYGELGARIAAEKDLQIEDEPVGNRMTIRESYTLSWEPDEETGLVFQTLPLLMESALTATEDLDRQAPLAQPYPYRLEEVVELLGPAGNDFEPVEERIANPWFRFEATSALLRDGIRLTYSLETLRDRVAVEDLETYARQVEQMQDALGYGIYDKEAGLGERVLAVTGLVVVLLSVFFAVGGALLARFLL